MNGHKKHKKTRKEEKQTGRRGGRPLLFGFRLGFFSERRTGEAADTLH
jgi:hypothetical protein